MVSFGTRDKREERYLTFPVHCAGNKAVFLLAPALVAHARIRHFNLGDELVYGRRSELERLGVNVSVERNNRLRRIGV